MRRTYIIMDEAWYAPAIRRDWVAEIWLGEEDGPAGTTTEASLEWRALEGAAQPAVQLRLWHDSWRLLRPALGLGQALAERGARPMSVAEAVTLLEGLGFVDVTPRTRPA